MRSLSLLVALVPLMAAAAEPASRPLMHQLPPAAAGRPPSQRDLVAARTELKRRFREPLAHTETATGASTAAAVLIDAAGREDDRALKWLLLLEARRLATAAGNAAAVARAIVIASATYEFDAVAEEYRCSRRSRCAASTGPGPAASPRWPSSSRCGPRPRAATSWPPTPRPWPYGPGSGPAICPRPAGPTRGSRHRAGIDDYRPG